MQWILQDFEDTTKLAEVLDRLDLNYSMHKVVPFVGELDPTPIIDDPTRVIMFGSYSLRHYAIKHNLTPGIYSLKPFAFQSRWLPYLLNSEYTSQYYTISDIPAAVLTEELYFVRPVNDSKEISGQVMARDDIRKMAEDVLALTPDEIIRGSLNHDTLLMLSNPVNIQQEWRVWIISDKVVTYSLYRLGEKVVYRPEIDDDALEFVKEMVCINPNYAPAYVIDICRTADGLYILETNCINAAGFYAADLFKLVDAFEHG